VNGVYLVSWTEVAHGRRLIVGLAIPRESEPRLDEFMPVSHAKQTVVFERISRSNLNCRFSRRRRASSSRSAVVSPFLLHPRSARYKTDPARLEPATLSFGVCWTIVLIYPSLYFLLGVHLRRGETYPEKFPELCKIVQSCVAQDLPAVLG